MLKRGLHHVLQELFEVGEDKITAFYPDLTAGVAGYLRSHQDQDDHVRNFAKAGRAVETAIQNIGGWLEHSSKQAWGYSLDR